MGIVTGFLLVVGTVYNAVAEHRPWLTKARRFVHEGNAFS